MRHEHTYDPCLIPLARRLRREMTPAEKVLWKHLRGRRFAGIRFRRQQPVGSYIADFFCAEARLILELDGESHVGREERDAHRQRVLEGERHLVLRFWNPEVYDEIDVVLEAIWQAIERRRPIPVDAPGATGAHPSPPALSPKGRGEQDDRTHP